MIDHELRSKAVGASEVAAVVGLDKWKDAFSVYVSKVGLVEPTPPSAVQRRGKYFEVGVIEWFSDVTKQKTEWCDQTIQSRVRSWQCASPDAFIINGKGERVAGVDAKTIGFQVHDEWGEAGTDLVPPYVSLQCQWSCSTLDMPYWDVAGAMSMDELRVYRIHRDPQIEAILLEEVESFWKNSVLARVAPVPTHAPAAAEALKRMFAKNTESIRPATADEVMALSELKEARRAFDAAKSKKTAIENRIKLAIANSEGLTWGKDKVTYKLCKDTSGVDWEKVARLACDDEERLRALIADNEIIVKHGSRRLLVPRSWKSVEDEDE